MDWQKCVIDCGHLGGEDGWKCPMCGHEIFVWDMRRAENERELLAPPVECESCKWRTDLTATETTHLEMDVKLKMRVNIKDALSTVEMIASRDSDYKDLEQLLTMARKEIQLIDVNKNARKRVDK